MRPCGPRGKSASRDTLTAATEVTVEVGTAREAKSGNLNRSFVRGPISALTGRSDIVGSIDIIEGGIVGRRAADSKSCAVDAIGKLVESYSLADVDLGVANRKFSFRRENMKQVSYNEFLA